MKIPLCRRRGRHHRGAVQRQHRSEQSRENLGSYAYGGTYQGGAKVGALVDVKATISYSLEIVVGEQPGGNFLAYLLIEKEGAEYQKNPRGGPILPIFKFAPSQVTRGGGVPEFAPDTSWSIWKFAARTR